MLIGRIQKKLVLTEADKGRLLALARDLPRVWRAPTTTQADRKHILRLLVREVVLRPEGTPPHSIHVQVVWQTGAVDTLLVPRSPNAGRSTTPEALAAIAQLVKQGHTDAEVADALNQRGLTSATKQTWNKEAVRWARRHNDMPRWKKRSTQGAPRQLPKRRADGLYSVRGVAARLGVQPWMVRRWLDKGWLKGVEGGGYGHGWRVKLDRSALKRLNELRARLPTWPRQQSSETSAEERGHHE